MLMFRRFEIERSVGWLCADEERRPLHTVLMSIDVKRAVSYLSAQALLTGLPLVCAAIAACGSCDPETTRIVDDLELQTDLDSV